MQYTVEFRNKDEALALAERIRTEVDSSRQYRYMEFCGGHTHVLARWGLTDLLPSNIRMIHGRLPGLRAANRTCRHGAGSGFE